MREYGYTIPGTLTLPDRTITNLAQSPRRKYLMFRLELLKTNDVRFLFHQPCRQIVQTLINVVDVESGDLQMFCSEPQTPLCFDLGCDDSCAFDDLDIAVRYQILEAIDSFGWRGPADLQNVNFLRFSKSENFARVAGGEIASSVIL